MDEVLVGPDIQGLEQTALERAATAADSGQILYLIRDSTRRPQIEACWKEMDTDFAHRIGTIDDFTNHLHERMVYEPSALHIGSGLRDRLCAFHAVATRLAVTPALRTRVERRDTDRPFAPVDSLFAHVRDLTGPHAQSSRCEDDDCA